MEGTYDTRIAGGMQNAKSVLGGSVAGPMEDKPSPTELARLYEGFAQSTSRLRDMLGAMERRLDFVSGPVPQSPQGAMSVPTPPAQPGTIEALREVSRSFHDLCGTFDGELCRMMKIL